MKQESDFLLDVPDNGIGCLDPAVELAFLGAYAFLLHCPDGCALVDLSLIHISPETRKRMSKVKLKGGKAEILLAKALWHQGYRYRKNDKRLPGSPDIAILKYHIAVFVDGEFWHGKDWEARKMRLKRNREYWIEKIEENMARDLRDDHLLVQAGWVPIHFWEKEVIKDLSTCVATIEEIILAQLIDSADAQEAIDYEE